MLTDLEFFEKATPGWQFLEVQQYWAKISSAHPPAPLYLATLEEAETRQGESEEMANTFARVGRILGELGLYDAQLPVVEKSLAMMRKILGEEHPDIATSYHNLGVTLYKTERYEKAGEYLRKAYAILSEKLGVDHSQTKDCKSWLDDLPKG